MIFEMPGFAIGGSGFCNEFWTEDIKLNSSVGILSVISGKAHKSLSTKHVIYLNEICFSFDQASMAEQAPGGPEVATVSTCQSSQIQVHPVIINADDTSEA